MPSYLAIDIGAESGRLIIGTVEKGVLSLREIHRFSNGMLLINGHYHWNVGHLYAEIVKGIEICINKENIQPESIGIDTWGVDYGLLAEDGSLMGLPFAYRDSRTENAIDDFCEKVSKEDIYAATGNLFASYNTLFQLYAAKKYHSKLIDSATDLLFIPDLLAYFLTGEKKTEFSFATTSQLFNRTDNKWDEKLFKALAINPAIMQTVVETGSIIGKLNQSVIQKTGATAIPVVAVATHDTASAIAAIPATTPNWAFISSGTWSLMGIETDSPILTKEALANNFTNEGGLSNSNYLLKNLMGLWILQQCKAAWKDEEYDYAYLVELSQQAEPFYAFIDIDDSSFLNPTNMCKAIDAYCTQTNQLIPENHGQYVRVVLESLAMKYRHTLYQLQQFKKIEEVCITGGGIRNEALCQFTANACGIRVTTALAEGTAAGNIMVQAMSMGEMKSPTEIRTIIANSCQTKTYVPQNTSVWNDAYNIYLHVTGLSNS